MSSLEVLWIIHAGFLLDYKMKTGEIRILIDPFLEPLGEKKKEYLDKLINIDLLLITHSHFDHMGNACEILRNNPNAKYVAIFELANYMEKECKVGNEGVGMNIGGTWIYKKGGFELPITMTHSFHSCEVGEPTGFLIRFPNFTTYHPGDTGLFYDMMLFNKLYDVKLALLPIGGYYTMGIEEAKEAVKLLSPRYVIPMHYKTFPVIDADPNVFKKKVEEETGSEVIILNPGESYIFEL